MLDHFVDFLSSLYINKNVKIDNKNDYGTSLIEGKLIKVFKTCGGIQFLLDNGQELYGQMNNIMFVCVGGVDIPVEDIFNDSLGLLQYKRHDVEPYFTQFFARNGEETCVMLME